MPLLSPRAWGVRDGASCHSRLERHQSSHSHVTEPEDGKLECRRARGMEGRALASLDGSLLCHSDGVDVPVSSSVNQRRTPRVSVRAPRGCCSAWCGAGTQPTAMVMASERRRLASCPPCHCELPGCRSAGCRVRFPNDRSAVLCCDNYVNATMYRDGYHVLCTTHCDYSANAKERSSTLTCVGGRCSWGVDLAGKYSPLVCCLSKGWLSKPCRSRPKSPPRRQLLGGA